jgi:hypothetical protein
LLNTSNKPSRTDLRISALPERLMITGDRTVPTKTTKKEISSLLSKIDVLEVLYQQIDKALPDTTKRSLASAFQREAAEYIKEQRSVILVAIKVK